MQQFYYFFPYNLAFLKRFVGLVSNEQKAKIY